MVELAWGRHNSHFLFFPMVERWPIRRTHNKIGEDKEGKEAGHTGTARSVLS